MLLFRPQLATEPLKLVALHNTPSATARLGRLILETDPGTIASRVAMRGADADVPLAEQVYPLAVPPALVSFSRCSNCFCMGSNGSRTNGLTQAFGLGQLRNQTFSKALATAKEQIARSLLK